MKLTTQILATALLATTAAPALAAAPTPLPKPTPQMRQMSYFPQVKDLAVKAGVSLKLNQPHCLHNGKYNAKVVGTYNSVLREICIVDHNIIGAKLWYSTFYHELFHFVQDSLDGTVGDDKLFSFFTVCEKNQTPKKCKELYLNIYTSASQGARRHADTYAAKQASSHMQWIEREAVLFSDQPEVFPTMLNVLLQRK